MYRFSDASFVGMTVWCVAFEMASFVGMTRIDNLPLLAPLIRSLQKQKFTSEIRPKYTPFKHVLD